MGRVIVLRWDQPQRTQVGRRVGMAGASDRTFLNELRLAVDYNKNSFRKDWLARRILQFHLTKKKSLSILVLHSMFSFDKYSKKVNFQKAMYM